SDAAGGCERRDQARLTERDRQRAEGDLAGVDGQRAVAVDGDAEPVHAAWRGPERRTVGLDAQPVVARAMARTLQPEVLQARVGLAAQVRAALVERPDVEGRAVA